jgi:2',3'-cyclic-nucleotide 2'-phosphodiesterase (5'-nucleotidase family)
MLLLGQSLIAESVHGVPFDLYIDLGNSFYPGPVSKYSYGSVMMDFFTYFNCAATLVSSRDISIGLTNLEFLAKGRTTKLLSINITRDNTPVFNPYFIISHDSRKIGFIGVTSSEISLTIADKKILKYPLTIILLL